MTEPALSIILQSIQHRCPKMREHIDPKTFQLVNVPCAECYSAFVTSVRIPYQPATPWRGVNEVSQTDSSTTMGN